MSRAFGRARRKTSVFERARDAGALGVIVLACGCGDGSAAPHPAATAGETGTAGATAGLGGGSAGERTTSGGAGGASSGAPAGSGGGFSGSGGLGGAAGAGENTGQEQHAGGGGAPNGSGAGGAPSVGAGTGGQSGTAHGGQSGGPAAGSAGSAGKPIADGPVPDLRFSGLVSAVELAPLRLAASGIYPAKITIGSGGVDDLCGSPKVDIATNAETQFLRASATSGCEKLRVIFTVCEGLYRIVARKSAGITTLADLAGKRVMAPSGASSAYYLSKMLTAAGLTAGTGSGQVNIVSGSANGSTFSGGSAPDAATIWEPGIEQASEELGSDALEFQHDGSDKEVYRELFNLHTTTDVLADAGKRRGIVALVRALIVASAELRDDPTVADTLLTGPVGVSKAVLDESMHYERYAGTLVSDVLDVMTEEEPWRANVDNRAARSRDELAKLVDESVFEDALADP